MILFYPTKPYKINQFYGVYRPEIYSQFGFTQHNGVDIALGADSLVRAEIPCEYYRQIWQPKGGGLTLSVISQSSYIFDDGIECHVLIDYLHLKEILLKVGEKVGIGYKLAIADNTGFSTGPHTHIQYRRVMKTLSGVLTNVDKNEANNSFNPEPYRSGMYAVDFLQAELKSKQLSLIDLLKKLLDKLKK